MPLSADEYAALSPEEQRAHDQAAAQREKEEQSALPYRWTQSLDHVEVNIPVPSGTRSKQVQVDLRRAGLKVAVQGTVVVEVRSISYAGRAVEADQAGR